MARDDNYTNEFYQKLDETSAPAALRILPAVFDILKPAAVIDVGCGDGSWLKAAEKLGALKIFGVDGPWIDENQSKLQMGQFMRAELATPFAATLSDKNFDMGICLEVAEHLPPSAAESFVTQLAQLAPVILFSAALPGQGGTGHVNEQPPEYWAQLFANQGFIALDVLRWQFWHEKDVAWWYRQNMILFVKPEVISQHQILQQWQAQTRRPLPDAVHPERFSFEQKYSKPKLSRWIKMFPEVIDREIRRKLVK